MEDPTCISPPPSEVQLSFMWPRRAQAYQPVNPSTLLSTAGPTQAQTLPEPTPPHPHPRSAQGFFLTVLPHLNSEPFFQIPGYF